MLISGGAVGTLARYSLSGLTHRVLNPNFPYGTLAVNLLGSLIIGLLWGLFESETIGSNLRTFLFIGILGSFTTFSTFMLESMNLLRDGEIKLAIFNVLANNMVGFLLVFSGFIFARWIITTLR